MSASYRLSRPARIAWVAVLVAIPLATLGALFGMTDDTLVDHQGSDLATRYTSAGPAGQTESEPVAFPTRYGREDGTSTLVLYDDQSADPDSAEMYAIATANLATHFGQVEITTTDDYQAEAMTDYDAAIFVGADHESDLPQTLLDDVRAGEVPVLWLGQNAEALVEGTSATGTDFVTQYGWDPQDPIRVDSDDVRALDYADQVVQRVAGSTSQVYTPRIVDADLVDVVAMGRCGDSEETPSECAVDTDTEMTELPWIIRSQNLTYVTELPLHHIDRNHLYLVFADLYYDLLAPDTEPVRQAAVRLEDVGPEADPDDLREVANYLHAEDIPFQVAVIPVHIDRTPDGQNWYGLSLLDAPEVVEALEYMQQRGGTLIQHGTTHQYGGFDNPYSGRSGEDYEFYQYGCSATDEPPYQWQGCEQDSWVRKIGPVPQDSVSDHTQRLEHGRQIMVQAGLGEPAIFETPHYTASVNAYTAMAHLYEARYEQVEYYAGMISSGRTDPDRSYAQIFPYSVHDIYGGTVYPENLQNVTEVEQNNHAVRTPQTIIDRAEANLVVTESTASFYFHPFLDIDYLQEVVDGVHDLGYTFVAVDELR